MGRKNVEFPYRRYRIGWQQTGLDALPDPAKTDPDPRVPCTFTCTTPAESPYSCGMSPDFLSVHTHSGIAGIVVRTLPGGGGLPMRRDPGVLACTYGVYTRAYRFLTLSSPRASAHRATDVQRTFNAEIGVESP